MSGRSRAKAIAAVSAVAASALAALTGAGVYRLLHRPLPRTRGTVRMAGLHGPVEVVRDRWGVPHIYAAGTHDLFFAQGYVHAQDRLWQMEFSRRVVAGRLSELFGKRTARVDGWLRTIGMRRVAEQEVSLLAAESRAELEAYAAGVNARIAEGRLPVEFTLLRHRPEPWAPADSLSWAKMMSWALSVNWESELLRARLIERLGPEVAAELEAGGPAGGPELIPGSQGRRPGGSAADRAGEGAWQRAEEARPFTGPPAQAGLGSNNWVLDGRRAAGGAPLLANDMHLTMDLPCIWYENHLEGGDLRATGISFPGIPGVISGHNGRVAWGFTNGFADVQDLYREHLRRTEDGRVQYEFRGAWHDAEVRREEIRVRGGQTAVEEVIVTRHGPVINALASEIAGEEPLALRWTSLEADTIYDALGRMMRAGSCLEFREALRGWTAPVQNVVYADVEGNIGYSLAGKVPVRAQGEGLVPVPGWTGDAEWTGTIPFDELPHLYNPAVGYVATANHRPAGDDYPHFLGREFASADRVQRIVELIEAREAIDVAYVQRMQFDLVSPTARIVAGHLGRLESDDAELAAVAERMGAWDGTLAADSGEAAAFEVFLRRMIERTLSGKLGELTARYAGKGPTPMLAESSSFGSRAVEWLLGVLEEPRSHWFDLGHGEGRDDVMRLALRDTVDFLKAALGPRPEEWAWGKLHTLTFAHRLARIKPLERLLNRGPYSLGGDGTTVWATGGSRYDLSSRVVIGPPFRFIADLGDLRNCRGLLAPGQSGQPGSRHYDDQIRAWFDGEYHPMLWAREDVEREAEATLRLVPA